MPAMCARHLKDHCLRVPTPITAPAPSLCTPAIETAAAARPQQHRAPRRSTNMRDPTAGTSSTSALHPQHSGSQQCVLDTFGLGPGPIARAGSEGMAYPMQGILCHGECMTAGNLLGMLDLMVVLTKLGRSMEAESAGGHSLSRVEQALCDQVYICIQGPKFYRPPHVWYTSGLCTSHRPWHTVFWGSHRDAPAGICTIVHSRINNGCGAHAT
jgi:hypothetical protein